jgi:hypothetical protein
MSINGKPIHRFTYNITAQGRLFLNRNGYLKETEISKLKSKAYKLQIMLSRANAIMIICISIAGVCVTYNTNQKDNKIDRLELRIEKQSETIESLNKVILLRGDTTKQK